ncbi:MAG TPA: fused MFS/spermidine synthase [Chloroflexota bacterium]
MRSHETVALWPGLDLRFAVERSIVSRRTSFQTLEICDTEAFGRALFLDHKIQSAETDEHVYHESLVHVALLAHPSPRRVYIAGGGEGATLREVLRHRSVERAVMVDIDGEAVEFVKQHMAAWHQGAFDDPRAELVIGDARAHLERSSQTYDAIVVDVTDPIAGGPSYLLFTREFYRLAASRLNPGGILALQAESTAPPLVLGHAAIVKTLRSVFPVARGYSAFVASFGEPWGFAVASQVLDPAGLTPEEVDRRILSRGLDLRHYDGETHRHMFALPRALREAVAASDRAITDDQPLVAY